MPASTPHNSHTTRKLPHTLGRAVLSDTSSNAFTPELTPSATPQSHHDTITAEKLDLGGPAGTGGMDANTAKGQEQAKQDVQPSSAEGTSSTRVEPRMQDAGQGGVRKVVCKKHSKQGKQSKKRSKSKKESSSSSSSDSSSEEDSSDSGDDDSEEDTSSSEESEDRATKEKKKSKARKKAKKLKEKKKARSKKHKDVSSESSEEETSSDETSSEDEKAKKARKAKKRKAKKNKKLAEADAAAAVDDEVDAMTRARALSALSFRGLGTRRGGRGGGTVPDRTAVLKRAIPANKPAKSKSAKKKKK